MVLATGASPVIPKNIRGADAAHVFTIRNVTDVCKVKDYIDFVNARAE